MDENEITTHVTRHYLTVLHRQTFTVIMFSSHGLAVERLRWKEQCVVFAGHMLRNIEDTVLAADSFSYIQRGNVF